MAIEIWTVYDRPADYPNEYVARKFLNEKPTDEVITSTSLDEVREALEDMGFVCLGVGDENPVIIETWM